MVRCDVFLGFVAVASLLDFAACDAQSPGEDVGFWSQGDDYAQDSPPTETITEGRCRYLRLTPLQKVDCVKGAFALDRSADMFNHRMLYNDFDGLLYELEKLCGDALYPARNSLEDWARRLGFVMAARPHFVPQVKCWASYIDVANQDITVNVSVGQSGAKLPFVQLNYSAKQPYMIGVERRFAARGALDRAEFTEAFAGGDMWCLDVQSNPVNRVLGVFDRYLMRPW